MEMAYFSKLRVCKLQFLGQTWPAISANTVWNLVTQKLEHPEGKGPEADTVSDGAWMLPIGGRFGGSVVSCESEEPTESSWIEVWGHSSLDSIQHNQRVAIKKG